LVFLLLIPPQYSLNLEKCDTNWWSQQCSHFNDQAMDWTTEVQILTAGRDPSNLQDIQTGSRAHHTRDEV
jgi:hypothetical protein